MHFNGKQICLMNCKAIWVQTECKKILAGTLKEMPYSLIQRNELKVRKGKFSPQKKLNDWAKCLLITDFWA